MEHLCGLSHRCAFLSHQPWKAHTPRRALIVDGWCTKDLDELGEVDRIMRIIITGRPVLQHRDAIISGNGYLDRVHHGPFHHVESNVLNQHLEQMSHTQVPFEPHSTRAFERLVDRGTQGLILEEHRQILVHVALAGGAGCQHIEIHLLRHGEGPGVEGELEGVVRLFHHPGTATRCARACPRGRCRDGR